MDELGRYEWMEWGDRHPDAAALPERDVRAPDPTEPAGHYWLTSRDTEVVANVRADARACSQRSGRAQRIHFHAYGTSCDGEVHENVWSPQPMRLAG